MYRERWNILREFIFTFFRIIGRIAIMNSRKENLSKNHFQNYTPFKHYFFTLLKKSHEPVFLTQDKAATTPRKSYYRTVREISEKFIFLVSGFVLLLKFLEKSWNAIFFKGVWKALMVLRFNCSCFYVVVFIGILIESTLVVFKNLFFSEIF